MDLKQLQSIKPEQDLTAFERAELDMLRAFYLAWEELHAIPNDKMHRNQKEVSAQRLVERAHALRRLKDEKPRVLVPRFSH